MIPASTEHHKREENLKKKNAPKQENNREREQTNKEQDIQDVRSETKVETEG
jgi:hypothetical protein